MKFPKFKFRAAPKTPRQIIVDSLGKLELETMQTVWRRGAANHETSVRDVCVEFGERIAYTTVMTTLDRLHKKGLLERRKAGRAFFYTARFSVEQLERRIAGGMIDNLLDETSQDAVLSYFVESVSERDARLLDELERLVQEKRRAIQDQDAEKIAADNRAANSTTES